MNYPCTNLWVIVLWDQWRFIACTACHPLTHYCDVIMGAMASQITSLTIVYSTVYSDADQRKHQSSAWLAFVRRIRREPVNSSHKWPVMRKMIPFDDVIMNFVTFLKREESHVEILPKSQIDTSFNQMPCYLARYSHNTHNAFKNILSLPYSPFAM